MLACRVSLRHVICAGFQGATAVPGLAENRPSVLKGDRLFVRPTGSSGTKEWEGFVHEVHKEEVLLKFNANFHSSFIANGRYNVRFSVNRSTFKFMHEAIELVGKGKLHPAVVMPQLRTLSTTSVQSMGPHEYALVIDTETSGPYPSNDSASSATRIVQIAAVLLHLPSGCITHEFSAILKPDQGETYGNQNVHGISTERALLNGRNKHEVMKEFCALVDCASVLVGHQLSFDLRAVGVQLHALGLPPLPENKATVDTMQTTRTWVGALGANDKVKMPKLEELYAKVFGRAMEGGHDAYHDARNLAVCVTALLQSGACDVLGGLPVKPTVNMEEAKVPWVNRSLNTEQRLAVSQVLAAAHVPCPYLLFGPPGTGKTSTMVEMIVQVLKAQPTARLLVTAPSNSAADLLAERVLASHPRSQVLRINAYQRPKSDMLDVLEDVSNYDDAVGAYVLPSKEGIMAKRVVVVTCLMAAKVYAAGVSETHFTHVFIDEAGHAEEPLALAPIAGLLSAKAQLVMAGDPQQLGPVILSKLAKTHGLATSLMERLITEPPYKKTEQTDGVKFNPPYITMLLNNYRSHPKILELPNKLFYDGELVPAADQIITHALTNFDGLPTKGFPMVFHGIRGKDQQEGNSPSWFNTHEISQVLAYARMLLDFRPARLQAGDIGIISPYRRQVQKIRQQVLSKISNAMKVGSVEEFQGQERKVIIISTVRSDAEHIAFDLKHRLGFLANPKRLNVAVTRAKALVIVVGNPDVLVHDPYWSKLLAHIHSNGGWTGSVPYTPVSAQPQGGAGGGEGGDQDDLSLLLQQLSLGENGGQGGEGSGAAPAWMSMHGAEGGEMLRRM